MLPLLPVPGLAASADESAQDRSDRWIVQLKADIGGPVDSGLEQRIGDASLRPLEAGPGAYLVSFDGSTNASDGVARLMSDPAVAYVEPNIMFHYQFVPNDPHFNDQSWAKTVQLPDAWSIATGRPSTIVAVLDSGVRSDHPDLTGKLVSGYDFINKDSDPQDEVGHGTAVAGILAAAGNNSLGIAGAAMDVAIMPVKVGDATGAPLGTIVEGIYYAVDHGATVINLSLGTDTDSAKLKDAVEYAYTHNVEVVAAAGNLSGGVAYPANYLHTISVAATTANGRELAGFSSRISRVDVSAPGIGVYTTTWNAASGNGWAAESGTSFATPIVAGVIALMRSANPDLTVEQVRQALTGTAHPLANGGVGGGAGLIDAPAAIRKALVPSFAGVWQPSDEPVYDGSAHRTWLWGPHAFAQSIEPFQDTQRGDRLVMYYDKSRMEVTDPYADRTSSWYVTNGLLVNEMVTGRMQVGKDSFELRDPATVPVSGDPDDTNGPTYASFAEVLGSAPLSEGSAITQTINRAGQVGNNAQYAGYGVTADAYVSETKHRIANVFWDYLNSSGLLLQNGQYQNARQFDPVFYATGFPITEAYWSQVKAAGRVQNVLIQCFERRCLTYMPENPAGWQVEMGNVGQHYYRWRYGDVPAGPAPDDPTAVALGR
jgi:hypothetical protein